MPWIAPVVGGVLSIGSGIFGSSQASKQNAEARKNYNEQKKLAKQQARISNRYQKKAFEAEKKDYFAAREFQYDTAVRQWQYDTEIQDYSYVQRTKEFRKSAENYVQQRTFNTIAGQMAYESQQASFNEFLASQAFESQGSLVENLNLQGKAALRQAGGARAKGLQSTIGEEGRNAAIMAASLRGAAQEFERGLREASLQEYAANLAAMNNLMISPERLPEIPIPLLGPERTFVEPAEILPGAVPPPQYQSTMMPLISGITSATTGILSAYNFKTGKFE